MNGSFRSTRDIIVRTPQFDAARQFYEGVLGLAVAHRGEQLVGYETGSFRLYLEPGAAQGPVFEFLVNDLAAARQQLLAAGCQILEEDVSVPRCYVRDPFGMTFNIAAARAA